MKKKHLKLILCVAIVSVFLALTATVVFATNPEPIYISAIGADLVNSDGSSTSSEFARYNSSNRIYLHKSSAEALSYNENTRTFTKFNLESMAGSSVWLGYKSSKYYQLSGPTTITINGKNYSTYTYKGAAQSSLPTANMVESGLYYTLENGVLTITGEIKKMSDGSEVPWLLPIPAAGFGAITEIIVQAEVNSIPDHCFNIFNKVTKITLPGTVKYLYGESFARMTALKSVLVAGSGITVDGTLDIRNIIYHGSNAFQETFQNTDLYVFLGLNTCGINNVSFSTSTSKSNLYVYVPHGEEECNWVTTTKSRCATLTVMPNPECRIISELGYQVRTEDYNGLRGRFAYNKNGINEGCTLVEAGVIIGKTGANGSCGYKLTKDSNGEYVTTDPYVRKMIIDDEKAPNGLFNVAIVNYSSKLQMRAPIFMSGYEVWVDDLFGFEYYLYTAETENHCKPASLYSATLGMYRAGLINSSINNGITFWDVLDGNHINLSHTITDAARAVTNYPYTLLADGSFVDKTNTNVKVYVFKDENDKYTAIVRGTGTFNGGGHSINYVKENYLSESFIGVPIDVIVIDEGISSVSEGALSGFSEYYNYNATDPSKCADFHTSLTTIIYANSVTNFAGQSFHSNYKMDTLVRFNALKAYTTPDYVKMSAGIVDLSTFTSGILTADKFSRCKMIETVILPVPSSSVAIPARIFQSASALSRIYVAGDNVPAENTANIGSLYTFNYSAESTSKVFEGTLINTVVSGTSTYTRTSGNTWTLS